MYLYIFLFDKRVDGRSQVQRHFESWLTLMSRLMPRPTQFTVSCPDPPSSQSHAQTHPVHTSIITLNGTINYWNTLFCFCNKCCSAISLVTPCFWSNSQRIQACDTRPFLLVWARWVLGTHESVEQYYISKNVFLLVYVMHSLQLLQIVSDFGFLTRKNSLELPTFVQLSSSTTRTWNKHIRSKYVNHHQTYADYIGFAGDGCTCANSRYQAFWHYMTSLHMTTYSRPLYWHTNKPKQL